MNRKHHLITLILITLPLPALADGMTRIEEEHPDRYCYLGPDVNIAQWHDHLMGCIEDVSRYSMGTGAIDKGNIVLCLDTSYKIYCER